MVEQDDEAHYAKLVTRVVAGCDHMFKCLRMFRRTENIMEIQVGVMVMMMMMMIAIGAAGGLPHHLPGGCLLPAEL